LSVFIVTALLIFSQSCLHNKFEDFISKLPVEKLVVIEQKEICFKDSIIIGLSPDGLKLAVYNANNRRLSVHDADTQEEIMGIDMKSGRCDISNLSWSPDSNYIAFTEDLFRAMKESDLWLMDIQKKTTVNLTDDNIEGTQEKVLFSHHMAIGYSGKYLGIGLNWSASANIFIHEFHDKSRGWLLTLGPE